MASKKKQHLDPHTGKPTDKKPPKRGKVDPQTGRPVSKEAKKGQKPTPQKPGASIDIEGKAYFNTKRDAIEGRPEDMSQATAAKLTYRHPEHGLWTYAEPKAEEETEETPPEKPKPRPNKHKPGADGGQDAENSD